MGYVTAKPANEDVSAKKYGIFQNIMHRLYPYRFIAVFVAGGILGYLLIR